MPDALSARALCSLADVKTYLDPDDPNDNSRDDLLTLLINAASTEMHKVARREFVAINAVRNAQTGVVTVAAQTRTFDAADAIDSDGELWVGDLGTFASVEIDDVAIAGADVVPLPRVREEWQPIERLRFPKQTIAHTAAIGVAGVWGFPTIPQDVRHQTIVTVSIWAQRDLTTFSEVFVAEEGRVEIPRSLPRTAWETAIRYRRRRGITSVRVRS